MKPFRVLVVDDSPLNRSEIVMCLTGIEQVEVVGAAADGSEALRMARDLKPDAITLDLEMPKMDGFTFLRVIPDVWLCPVLVISSHSDSRQVLRALELGAIDFVLKPETSAERIELLRSVLLEKLGVMRSLSPKVLTQRARSLPPPASRPPASQKTAAVTGTPRWVVALAASTGGPSAISEILSQLSPEPSFAVVVAQHMPAKFTQTFAERLDRHSRLRVSEASARAPLMRGTALVCPGRKCMEVHAEGSQLTSEVRFPSGRERYVPNADRLLCSVARAAGANSIAVILTGMGDDGTEGAREIAKAGGIVLAESEETAVVYGMPRAAVQAGVVRRSLPLGAIGAYLNDLLRNS
jgi:two-component system, chemotaxis family, protein-glutamate methylesterase/glutaminase